MSIIINRVYTGVGDRGTTRLGGGQEVNKTDVRIEAYGTIDELNAALGLVYESLQPLLAAQKLIELPKHVRRIQNELFDLGGELAVLPADRHPSQVLISAADGTRLEAEIDEANASLPTLRSFILPGGGLASAHFHLARTIARRAERRLVALHEHEPQRSEALVYLNRLSDWLFVMGRAAAVASEQGEVLWKPGDRS